MIDDKCWCCWRCVYIYDDAALNLRLCLCPTRPGRVRVLILVVRAKWQVCAVCMLLMKQRMKVQWWTEHCVSSKAQVASLFTCYSLIHHHSQARYNTYVATAVVLHQYLTSNLYYSCMLHFACCVIIYVPPGSWH